jgi:hypothetical protein
VEGSTAHRGQHNSQHNTQHNSRNNIQQTQADVTVKSRADGPPAQGVVTAMGAGGDNTEKVAFAVPGGPQGFDRGRHVMGSWVD